MLLAFVGAAVAFASYHAVGVVLDTRRGRYRAGRPTDTGPRRIYQSRYQEWPEIEGEPCRN